MSFNTTQLGEYISNKHRYINLDVYKGAPSFALLMSGNNAQLNNKPGKSAMNFLDVGVNFQKAGCGRSLLGTTPVSSKEIETVGLMDQQSYCPRDFDGKYMVWALQNGMSIGNGWAPEFVSVLLEGKQLAISEAIENLIWKGDKTSANDNLNRLDGYLKQISDSLTTIDVTASGTDMIQILQNEVALMPITVRHSNDFRIFIGEDDYAEYLVDLANRNIYHEVNLNTLFGTTQKFQVTPGLNGTGKRVYARIDDLAVSTDLVSDENYLSFEYSNSDKVWYLDWDFAIGVLIGRDKNIGMNKSVPVSLPVITTQPTNQSEGVGDTATFNVVATGATSYQWQLDSGSGFANITGATSASYTTPTLVAGDDGNEYRVLVTNAAGTVTSDAATLTVA